MITFSKLHQTYFQEFVNEIQKIIEPNQFNENIKSRIQGGRTYATDRLWKENSSYLLKLNYYSLEKTQEEDMDIIALNCCSYKVKDLNNFMKHFVNSTFKDSDEKKIKRETKLKENEDSMIVLLGEFESLPSELILYYIEEKLIAHGISLLYLQGKFNWMISILFHKYNSCNLDSKLKEKLLPKVKKEKLISETYNKDFQYCSQFITNQGNFYSFLFEIDFMEDANHKYCEIVFFITNDGEVSIIPRTDYHYIYYLPCDNQQNSKRFGLLI